MGQLTVGSWLEQLISLALQQVLQKGVETPQLVRGTADRDSCLEQLIILALQQVLQQGVETPQLVRGTAESCQ